MDADQGRQPSRLREVFAVTRFLDVAEPNVPVGQHPFVLGMEQNLEKRKFSSKQAGNIRGFDFQQLTVDVAHQHLGVVQVSLPLASMAPP